jgi:hypothetical protein
MLVDLLSPASVPRKWPSYLIERIAEQFKSGELRNPTIYEFNPDVVYVPPRQRAKSKSAGRTQQPTLPTGNPPPEETAFAEK